MNDTIACCFGLAVAFIVGLMVGYSYGEEHAVTVALKAQWEREAKEWDERHGRLVHELGVEVDG